MVVLGARLQVPFGVLVTLGEWVISQALSADLQRLRSGMTPSGLYGDRLECHVNHPFLV